ncbi:MAG: DUF1566 domain-containing protein [Mongoliibacter sp.]|uniref:hypothetical protein n=1 Tax=Mongoliibacter sp. TaxID=2022438 RepID=UPI0012F32D95|nr:hypothetical protein [Mongoliibacter sp.]TVP46302.1 MAG: DUF1566 domain-containing protein [Mongoliibacter sp.]
MKNLTRNKALFFCILLGMINISVHGQVMPFGMLSKGATTINNPPAVGDFHQGGVIFYLFQSGDPGYVAGETHGLIAAIEDQHSGVQWWKDFTSTFATAKGIGAGQTNTAKIINTYGRNDIYAAIVCDDYSFTVEEETYDDWFLPSEYELNLMYLNKGTIDAIAVDKGGHIFFNRYASSTEWNNGYAMTQNFNDGRIYHLNKRDGRNVRAIRAF